VIPSVDAASRGRLALRFGAGEMDRWFDELPAVLRALAGRWQLELTAHIPRGSVSAVFRARTAGGRAAVLKVSPDRARLASEAAALDGWSTTHTPEVLALDEELGALLLEGIEAGEPLDVSATYPDFARVADLIRALHLTGVPDNRYPTVARRSEYVFVASTVLYDGTHPGADVVPRDLFERGRSLADALARDDAPRVLLHGDLTPRNILDAGPDRGLVALDPAPCLGDPGFDAIDLLLWQAGAVGVIEDRAVRLAAATGLDAERLVAWCTAFAAMSALELATAPGSSGADVEALLILAGRAPRV